MLLCLVYWHVQFTGRYVYSICIFCHFANPSPAHFFFTILSMNMMWRCLELWLDKILLLNMLFSS